jgi:hypothetical protein
MFSESISSIDMQSLSAEEREVVELAKMYAADSKAWLSKKDYNTSFASISYAHGLLDAIRKLKQLID